MRPLDDIQDPAELREIARAAQSSVAMLQAKGVVLDRARLEAAVYGFGEELESNAIEVHVHHLRRKLGEGLIRTVRGVGYFIARETPP